MSDPPGLKVLFLTSSYPRGHDDSASVFLRYLAEELAGRGYDVHILAPADGDGETAIEGKVTVHRFKYFPSRLQALAYGSGVMPNLRRSPWLWLQVPFFVLTMALTLWRTIKRERIDLVHAHWVLPQGMVAVLAKSLCRIPVVTTVHGADAFSLRGKIARALKEFVIARSDAWTANTPASARAIASTISAPQARIVPMGVDVEMFASGDSTHFRTQLPEHEYLLLFVGRLVEKKGCQTLLDALSLLRPELLRQTTLWIVGDGAQKRLLEQSARKLGIERRIRFWGALDNRRLPDFYAAADLFVAPSIVDPSGDTEGQGIVLLEAFAGGVCVLASYTGGIDAVVTDGVTGVLVEPNQPRQLAREIERLLDDPALRARLARNAFAEVAEKYAWKKIAGQFDSLYSSLVRHRTDEAL